MTTVHPALQFHMIEESTTSTRARLTRQTSPKVSVVAAADVTDDVSDQSNKESVDAGFCGEPFAANGELLSSLSPLLFSMKLFGLYFHREDPHRRRTDDPEWNPATISTRSPSTKLRVYATIALIILWLNVVRFVSMFTRSDRFGDVLLKKITTFTWFGLVAILQTTYYFACHTGKLLKILLTLPVTHDCVRGSRRVAIGLTTFVWINLFTIVLVAGYFDFNNDENYTFIVAPFGTNIYLPKDKIKVAKIVGYFGYLILLFPGVYFAQSVCLALVYIFYSEFKKLKKNFRRAIGDRGRFSGDLSLFRRRHH